MRIATVIRNYSPGDGLNAVAVKLAQAYGKIKGVESALIYSDGAPPLRHAKKMGFLQTVRYLSRSADVAHSHIGTSIVKCNLAKLANPSLSHVTTYNVIAPPHLYPPYKRALAFHKFAYSFGHDSAIGISKYACRDFEEKFGRPAKLIYDGVDTRQFKPDAEAGEKYRRKLGIDASTPLVGYISRFHLHKNHESAIRALAKLPRETVLLLGGVGGRGVSDTLEHCKQVALELGVKERVKFLGFVPERDMNAFYNAIDVHAFPSRWEGFGLSIVEASASGTPTVAYEVYSVAELVGKGQGNGFCVRTQEEFTEGLRTLLLDSRLNRKLRASARKFGEKFAWEKVAEKYLEEFRRLKDRN